MRGFLKRFEIPVAWSIILIFCVVFWYGVCKGITYYLNNLVESAVQINMLAIDAKTYENERTIARVEADHERLKKEIEVYKSVSAVSGMSRTTMTVKAYTCIDDDKRPGDAAYCMTKDGTRLTKDHYYKIVAVKPGRYPLGTWLRLTHVNGGYITKVRVADWGDVDADTLDLFIHENDQQQALQWGRQQFRVQEVD